MEDYEMSKAMKKVTHHMMFITFLCECMSWPCTQQNLFEETKKMQLWTTFQIALCNFTSNNWLSNIISFKVIHVCGSNGSQRFSQQPSIIELKDTDHKSHMCQNSCS